MDYINSFSKSLPIHHAVQLIQPFSYKLTDMYKRSSRNELMFVGAATFFTLYNISYHFKTKQHKLNLPPSVPFDLPFFGHGLYLMCMPSKFLDWCHGKYGEVYTVNMFGKTITIAGGKSAEEALSAETSEMSLDHGILRDILHFDYLFDEPTLDIGLAISSTVAKIALTQAKMPMYEMDLKNGIDNASARYLKESTTVIQHPMVFFQSFVSYMSVPTLLGVEFALNTEVIESFARCTEDITSNVVLFMVTPKFLHKTILPYVQTSQKHIDCMIKYVAPAIRERREKMYLAQLAGQHHNLVENFLQGLIEYVNTDEHGVKSHCTAERISQAVLMVAFAAVHTTSINLSFSIYWLIARPDLKEKLMEEIERVLPGDTPITVEALYEMKFLNNFLREVLRQGVDKLGSGKKAMSDFTFSNGYQVPKGRLVETANRRMTFGDNFIRTKIDEMDPGMSRDKMCTAPGKNFTSFGMGKHLCPGRFFAIQEIQMTLIYLLRNYDIKTASGKRPLPAISMLGTMTASSEEPLVFTRKN